MLQIVLFIPHKNTVFVHRDHELHNVDTTDSISLDDSNIFCKTPICQVIENNDQQWVLNVFYTWYKCVGLCMIPLHIYFHHCRFLAHISIFHFCFS